jgi:drug/metabolite transporter (DMT)-like permease
VRAHNRGFLVVFVASVCLSTLPAAVKIGLTVGTATPLQLLAPRMVIGSSLIGLYLLQRRSGGILIDRRGRQSAALAGVFNLSALLFFYWALERIDAAVGMLVFSTYPALLLGVLALRGETITRLDWTRLAMALLGIVLVSDLTGEVDPLGIFFAVVCASFYALYMLVIHTRLVAYRATSTAFWITGTMGLLAYLLLPLEAPSEPLTSVGWGVVLWSAVIGTAVARVATIQGVRLLGGGQAALLMPIEAVMSLGWVALLLGERLAPMQWLGAGMIVGAVMLAPARRMQLARRSKRHASSSA